MQRALGQTWFCGNCAYFNGMGVIQTSETDDGVSMQQPVAGQCRRHTPQPFVAEQMMPANDNLIAPNPRGQQVRIERQIISAWPPTDSMKWCGDHSSCA